MSKYLKVVCPLLDTRYSDSHTSCLQCFHNSIHLYNAQQSLMLSYRGDNLRKINGLWHEVSPVVQLNFCLVILQRTIVDDGTPSDFTLHIILHFYEFGSEIRMIG